MYNALNTAGLGKELKKCSCNNNYYYSVVGVTDTPEGTPP